MVGSLLTCIAGVMAKVKAVMAMVMGEVRSTFAVMEMVMGEVRSTLIDDIEWAFGADLKKKKKKE